MEKAKARRLSQSKRYNLTGWVFLAPAALLIAVMSFYPMIRCLIYSFQKGATFANMQWYGLNNYVRMFQDTVFMQSLKNTFIYFLIQVPIMLILALILASMLNNKDLKCKGFFRTAIFNRRICQYDSDEDRHSGCTLCIPVKYNECPCDHHFSTDLEMDRIQHGILPLRSAEYRVFRL